MTQGELPKNKGEYTNQQIKIRREEIKRDISFYYLLLLFLLLTNISFNDQYINYVIDILVSDVQHNDSMFVYFTK